MINKGAVLCIAPLLYKGGIPVLEYRLFACLNYNNSFSTMFNRVTFTIDGIYNQVK